MRMSDSNNDQFVFGRVINQPIRKTAQSTTPDIFAERMPSLWKPANPLDSRDSLDQKCVAEPRNLLVIVRNRLVKFLPGGFKKNDFHDARYFASTCSSGTA